ncbi:MAG: GIY-YIG nuclease family protein [candidate division Zixibacteria bacterium]|nr:GIY-YIG nuclease family protein [candidate division Zixibacteria bacterium]
MNGEKLSWEFCQNNSDEILASGLERLRSVKKYDSSIRLPSTAGNYVISNDNTPLYTGEAGDLASRLKQQFSKNTSTFYKNYAQKQSHLEIKQNLQIEDFDVKFIETKIGRKELEEFGIVNLPTPLNKLQRGKRDIYDSPMQSDNWDKVQSEYSEIIKDGGKTVLTFKPVNWVDAKPFPESGLYVISNDSDEIIYIGESSNVGDRYSTHSKNTYFSAFRRNLGTKLLGFRLKEKNGMKRYFEPDENGQVDDYIRNCKIILQIVSFGRFELEEYLIRTIQPILNKKSK